MKNNLINIVGIFNILTSTQSNIFKEETVLIICISSREKQILCILIANTFVEF